jgi:hypothetical protein
MHPSHSIVCLSGSLQGSIKLRVVVKLVDRLKRRGHRMLIFSQSRMMLDILQTALAQLCIASCRIDGSVSARERQLIIDMFNGAAEAEGERGTSTSAADSDEEGSGSGILAAPSVCLLTTKACG